MKIDYNLIKNVYIRTEALEKVGISALIEREEVVFNGWQSVQDL